LPVFLYHPVQLSLFVYLGTTSADVISATELSACGALAWTAW